MNITEHAVNHGQDTIFALSSGFGVAGVAVVRISGKAAFAALSRLTPGRKMPKVRNASLRLLQDPMTGDRLDQALVLVFAGPASFTGEDCVELHLHGGRAVVEGVLSALAHMDGLRPAEAGEFSRRAFENGKLDLTEAEGLNDLIHAQTAAQKQVALRQMDGALRTLYEDWRARLMHSLAYVEADIDFPDEDLPEGLAITILPNILGLMEEIAQHIADGKRGRMLRDGCRLVILGAPNAGKSTLLNALANSDVAIVSDEEGTTRDSLEVSLDIQGFPVRIIDTAGVRGSDNKIEQEGVRRALMRAEDADLKLVLVRADAWPSLPSEIATHIDDDSIIIVTQMDRIKQCEPEMFHVKHLMLDLDEGMREEGSADSRPILISVQDGTGMTALLDQIADMVRERMAPREAPMLTRLRHQNALEDSLAHLKRFEQNVHIDTVLAAEDIRMATRSLGRITGRVGVEDMLDIVFGDFCIGK